MKETTRQLFDRAADAIEAADILLTNDKADFAAGRAYYAMFYTAEALLNEKGFKFGKHGSVIAVYGQHFSKTKELDPKFHRWLLTSFDQRQIGDYAFDPDVGKDVVVRFCFVPGGRLGHGAWLPPLFSRVPSTNGVTNSRI